MSTNVQVLRGNSLLTYSSFTNYYTVVFQAGDVVTLHGTNSMLGYSPGVQLLPNMTISGDGSNATYLWFDTNGLVLTNGISLNKFQIISTNVNPNGSQASAPTCLIGVGSGISVSGMTLNATNGGLIGCKQH